MLLTTAITGCHTCHCLSTMLARLAFISKTRSSFCMKLSVRDYGAGQGEVWTTRLSRCRCAGEPQPEAVMLGCPSLRRFSQQLFRTTDRPSFLALAITRRVWKPIPRRVRPLNSGGQPVSCLIPRQRRCLVHLGLRVSCVLRREHASWLVVRTRLFAARGASHIKRHLSNAGFPRGLRISSACVCTSNAGDLIDTEARALRAAHADSGNLVGAS